MRASVDSPATHQVESDYRQLTKEVLTGYSSSKERYYASGLWENGDPSCWYCNAGPAVGAAYLSDEDPAMAEVAIATLDRAISEHRLANGSFSGNTSPGITSAAFGIELGLAYIRLEPHLPAATRTLWQETLGGIAGFLISDKDATWYANGNINASYAGALYFAWRATGDQQYLDAYNAELAFTEAPTGHQWEGFGLVITQQPTAADGSDGRGFLTEGSPPGWDPEYSHLQLDWLSALYSASGDPRVLRLLNLILNQELTRVDPATFVLDAIGGTRKNEMMPFTSAALPLLVIDGKRPDLAPLLPAAFARLSSEYRESFRYTEHNFYRGVSLWLAPILLATSGDLTVPVPSMSAGTPSSGSATGSSGAPPATTGKPSSSHARKSPPATAKSANPPSISPGELHASRVEPLPELEVPDVEYAFATPATLTHGLVASSSRSKVAAAAFVCASACSLTVRPLLVIHRSDDTSPVVVQFNLKATTITLGAGGVFVSRVRLPRLALAAAAHGRAAFVRLRMTVLVHGMARQGRSFFFKLAR